MKTKKVKISSFRLKTALFMTQKILCLWDTSRSWSLPFQKKLGILGKGLKTRTKSKQFNSYNGGVRYCLRWGLCEVQLTRQYRYVQKKTFWASLYKIKIFINWLDQNFKLILLVSFSSVFLKIKVPISRVEIWEK